MIDLKAPFPYFGGKKRVAQEVWARFGAVKSYVEPFFGSGAVLLGRPQPFNGLETINDKDHFVANFWRALQADPAGLAKACNWPINETDLHARHLWLVNEGVKRIKKCYDKPDHYDLTVAAWWVWGISQWIGGGWCKSTPGHARPHLARPEGINAVGNHPPPSIANRVKNKLPWVTKKHGILKPEKQFGGQGLIYPANTELRPPPPQFRPSGRNSRGIRTGVSIPKKDPAWRSTRN